jgi:hypothetical protein
VAGRPTASWTESRHAASVASTPDSRTDVGPCPVRPVPRRCGPSLARRSPPRPTATAPPRHRVRPANRRKAATRPAPSPSGSASTHRLRAPASPDERPGCRRAAGVMRGTRLQEGWTTRTPAGVLGRSRGGERERAARPLAMRDRRADAADTADRRGRAVGAGGQWSGSVAVVSRPSLSPDESSYPNSGRRRHEGCPGGSVRF